MTTRKKLWLALAALAAVILLLVMLFAPLLRQPVSNDSAMNLAKSAALSPWGLTAMVIIVVCLLALAALGLLVKRCTDRPHPPLSRVFGDDGGTAALEMLLALPFIVMILLVLLQATLLWNANMVIHYAGFAATRTAITVIGAQIGNEKPYYVYNIDDAGIVEPSQKTPMIARAAVLALLPISAQLPATTEQKDPVMSGQDVANGVQGALAASSSGATDQPWPGRIARQFAYADYFVGGYEVPSSSSDTGTGIRLRRPDHWLHGLSSVTDTPNSNWQSSGNGRDDNCPYRGSKQTDPPSWTDWGWQSIPYCPTWPAIYRPGGEETMGVMDFASWEPIELTLRYPYELTVPWADRILFQFLSSGDSTIEAFTEPGTNRTAYYTMVTVKTRL
jgi:uncharacterized membrane protein YhaH (DUF805 family)